MTKLLGSICLALALLLFLAVPWGTAALADGQGRLFMVDFDSSQIYELNPSTGAVLNSFSTPVPSSEGPDGLAYCDGRMFFISSWETSTIFEINPQTGAVINSFPVPPGTVEIDALGLSGDRLYALDYEAGKIYVLNPNNGAVVTSYTPSPSLVGGGTFAGTRNSLFFTEEFYTIDELNPTNGAVLNSFSAPGGSGDIYGLGFSSSRNALFLGDVDNNTIYEVNPNNGAVKNSFSGPLGAYITALAADECVPPQPVGGELYPVSKLSILVPWLTLALVLALGGGMLVLRRRQAL